MLRAVGPVAGVIGGLCWAARWGADLAGRDPGWGPAVHWIGLAFLLVMLAGLGTELVSKGAVWLRAIVAVALPLLVWSVYAVVRGDGDGIVLAGVLGLLAALTSGGALLATRRAAPAPSTGRHGSHAAR